MIKRIISTAAVAAALAVAAVSCARNPQIYFVKGVVKELSPDGRTVVIAHEEIPGYMPAMQMPFVVKDARELAGLQTNDAVFFRMVVTADDAWIDRISKTGVAPAAPAPPNRAFRRVRMVEPLKVGDPLPDYRFTNELGQAVHLGQFQGQALAFTFIFTRCPYPLFCLRMSGNFAEAAKKLAAMPDAPTNWHLLSISFDTEFDSPAVLKAYAERYRDDPARWNFLTGELMDIDALTEQVGLMFPRSSGGMGFDHNLRTVIVDAQGRIQKVFTGNEWKVEDFIAELRQAAAAR